MAVTLSHHYLKQVEPVHLPLIQVVRVLYYSPCCEKLRLPRRNTESSVLRDLCDFVVFIGALPASVRLVPALKGDLIFELLVETE